MSANTILTSIVTGGANNHTTTAEEANAFPTDFVSAGVVGAITANTGSGGTGSFTVNQDTSPDMGITIKAGQAYISAIPSSQGTQVLRARAAADYTAYTINAALIIGFYIILTQNGLQKAGFLFFLALIPIFLFTASLSLFNKDKHPLLTFSASMS